MPEALNYRTGPQPGGPSMWSAEQQRGTPLNYRVGPQPGGPSMCLICRTTGRDSRQGSPLNAWMGGAMEEDWPEAFWPPGTRGSKKESGRVISPASEAVCVPARLAPPGSPQAKQLCHLTFNSHWGRAAAGKKCLASMHTGSLQSCPTLCSPADCGLPGLSVREGGSPGKNTGCIGQYWLP